MSVSATSQDSNRVEILKELNSNLSNCTGAVRPLALSIENKSIRGRKTFAGKDPAVVVAKLAMAFAMDSSVNEACRFAGISRYAFYRFCSKYPELRNTLESFRLNTTLAARMAWIKAIRIDGNWRAAQEYLKTRRPEEFV